MIGSRSPVVRLGIQVVSPLALIAAIFLFFAGHNRPGGGFAAGLVLGALVSLRTIAGLQRRNHAVPLLTAGAAVVALVALAPLVGGEVLLDQVVVDATVPVLGTIKSGSALVFDAGVTLIVVGLVVAVLDALGARDLAEPAGSGGGS